jgi:hypothetical protein
MRSSSSPIVLLYACPGAVVAVKDMPTLALPLVRKYQFALLSGVAKLLQPPASPSPAQLEATGTVLAACDLMARMLVAAAAALNQVGLPTWCCRCFVEIVSLRLHGLAS